jgi:hypothetical protein
MKTSKLKMENETVKIGDKRKCPQCQKMSRVVWVSTDEKKVGIRCPRYHNQMDNQSDYGSASRPQRKPIKNMVFIIENENETNDKMRDS